MAQTSVILCYAFLCIKRQYYLQANLNLMVVKQWYTAGADQSKSDQQIKSRPQSSLSGCSSRLSREGSFDGEGHIASSHEEVKLGAERGYVLLFMRKGENAAFSLAQVVHLFRSRRRACMLQNMKI